MGVGEGVEYANSTIGSVIIFMPLLVSKGTEHWIVFCEVCNMIA